MYIVLSQGVKKPVNATPVYPASRALRLMGRARCEEVRGEWSSL